jgi:hypothetical protein
LHESSYYCKIIIQDQIWQKCEKECEVFGNQIYLFIYCSETCCIQHKYFQECFKNNMIVELVNIGNNYMKILKNQCRNNFSLLFQMHKHPKCHIPLNATYF